MACACVHWYQTNKLTNKRQWTQATEGVAEAQCWVLGRWSDMLARTQTVLGIEFLLLEPNYSKMIFCA